MKKNPGTPLFQKGICFPVRQLLKDYELLPNMTRYQIAIWILTLLLGEQAHSLRAESTLATFFADITIPIGHPCMGGGVTPAHSIQERLRAKGFVLTLDDQKAIVVISLD